MTFPSTNHTRSHTNEKLKQLYLGAENPRPHERELNPFFCVEARIDFNDVRTGYRETVSLSKALEIYSNNADLLWTDDMIRDVDLSKASPTVPAGASLGPLPEFIDSNFLARMENQFVQYLLRSFEARIFRNFELNLYSLSGETRADFHRRCQEMFDGARRKELDDLRDVINRKLEQLKQKYLGAAEIPELEQNKSDSLNRVAFSRASDRVTELFNSTELEPKPVTGPAPFSSSVQEFEERLLSVEWEAQQAIRRLSDAYGDKARAMDEYILHPNLKDIHFVRSCILWMPRGTS